MSKRKAPTNRYAAKLLFQFRVVGAGAKMRICEERIIVLHASSAEEALKQGKRKGRESQFQNVNEHGEKVRFEFVGVMDLLQFGMECQEDEVWYDIRTRLKPMERKSKLIPKEGKLNAIAWERSGRRKRRPHSG